MSSSDNNMNTTGITGTQGDGPVTTEITAGFGIHIDKSVNSFAPEDKIDYRTTYYLEDSIIA